MEFPSIDYISKTNTKPSEQPQEKKNLDWGDIFGYALKFAIDSSQAKSKDDKEIMSELENAQNKQEEKSLNDILCEFVGIVAFDYITETFKEKIENQSEE